MIGEFPPRPKPEPSVRYVLEIHEHGDITVRCGDRYEDGLGEQEALWLVARILMTDGTVKLRTKAEHDAEHARWYGPASILEPWQKQIESAHVYATEMWRRTSGAMTFCGCGRCGAKNQVLIEHFLCLRGGSVIKEYYCDACSPVVVL